MTEPTSAASVVPRQNALFKNMAGQRGGFQRVIVCIKDECTPRAGYRSGHPGGQF
jgi:hypothetical protein